MNNLLNFPITNISNFLLLLLFSVVFLITVRGCTLLLKFYVLRKIGVDSGLQEVITLSIQFLITLFGLIAIWNIWEVDITFLGFIVSFLGIGIGFGLQNVANNLISGLIISLERPVQIGDFINLGDIVGTVQRIGGRSTEIRTVDQIIMIIPNSRFVETEVINWSQSSEIRLRISIELAYGSDVKKVKAALLEAAKTHPDILITPRPQVWLLEFGDNCLRFDLLVWIKEAEKQFQIKSDLNYRIEASLRRYGLQVPPSRGSVPQLDNLIKALLLQQGVVFPEENNQLTQYEETNPVIGGEFVGSLEERLHAIEVDEIVTAIRSPGGIEIKDRRYRLNIYPNCFIGSEAVDWLVSRHNCTRDEAVELGQILVDRGLIHHVDNFEPFRDGYFFYRFYADETII